MSLDSLLRTLCLALLLGSRTLLAATPADTLVVAKDISNLVSLDPAETFELTGGELINNLYARLFGYAPEDFATPRPSLVRSWSVSADGRTFRFLLRDGLRFQSGNPLRAEDAAFSLRRVVQLGLTPSFIFAQYGWNADNVQDKVRVVDGQLQLELDQAWAPSLLFSTLAAGVGSVVDERLVLANERDGDRGNAWLKTHSAGAGAFRLGRLESGQVVVLEAFDGYLDGAPGISRVVLRHVAEPAAQRLLLEKGDVDIARDLRPEQLATLADNPQVRLQQEDKVSELYLALSQRNAILAKPGVRQALRWAIDYQGLSRDLLGGQWFVHQNFIPRGVFAALDDNPYHYDPQKARRLLAEAGYPEGFAIDLEVINQYPLLQVGQALQANLAEAGVRVNLRVADANQVMGRFRSRQFDVVLFFWSHDYHDPHSSADFLLSNPDNGDDSRYRGALWRSHWQLPGQERIGAAAQTRDEARRLALYRELQEEVRDRSPLIFLLQQNERIALRRTVSGFIAGPAFDTAFYGRVRKHGN